VIRHTDRRDPKEILMSKEQTNHEFDGTAPVLVTGGTGTLGRLVVERLVAAGHAVRVVARNTPERAVAGAEFVTGDLATGEGIDDAVAGVEIVVHCAGGAKGDDDKARNLVAAAIRSGVRHLVYISVVGADRIPVVSGIDRNMFGYFESKRAAEVIIEESGIPWTTLRATQFHDIVFMVAEQMAKLPVIPMPRGLRIQPVDAGEVADRLVELALGAPAGLVPDLAGPSVYDMKVLIRGYLHATDRRRPILPIALPGRAAHAMVAGANLSPEHADGHRTWEEFLAKRVAA
jgi:uncharacterized protein YbjT (DUF2867 family)